MAESWLISIMRCNSVWAETRDLFSYEENPEVDIGSLTSSKKHYGSRKSYELDKYIDRRCDYRLHMFDRDTETDQGDRDEIFLPYVRLYREAYGPNFTSMDDNLLPHRDQLEDEYL
ncbi:hypothetical protein TNCV_917371 [Trichonephila clavipes]|nr:hypothetical protein TNCV_917371 [Trichonephila clavipes]